MKLRVLSNTHHLYIFPKQLVIRVMYGPMTSTITVEKKLRTIRTYKKGNHLVEDFLKNLLENAENKFTKVAIFNNTETKKEKTKA